MQWGIGIGFSLFKRRYQIVDAAVNCGWPEINQRNKALSRVAVGYCHVVDGSGG